MVCTVILIRLEAIFNSKAHRKSTFLLASLFSNSSALTTPLGPRLKPQKNKQGFDSAVRKSKSAETHLKGRDRGVEGERDTTLYHILFTTLLTNRPNQKKEICV